MGLLINCVCVWGGGGGGDGGGGGRWWKINISPLTNSSPLPRPTVTLQRAILLITIYLIIFSLCFLNSYFHLLEYQITSTLYILC